MGLFVLYFSQHENKALKVEKELKMEKVLKCLLDRLAGIKY